MQTSDLRNDGLLLLTAIIWGVAFVAQRVGMDFVGPFTYNGIRFALGSLVLLPVLLFNNSFASQRERIHNRQSFWIMIFGCFLSGLSVFAGASFQQMGLVYTTAGKAGFITGLYVIFVPLMGYFLKQWPTIRHWIGAIFAVIGLYLLCMIESLSLSIGDGLVLICAIFFALHVHIITWLLQRVDALIIAISQFVLCSLLSLMVSLLIETTTLENIWQAKVPILYGGFLSVGIAYTLQIVAQRKAHPSHAAIILSLEAVFAVLGGWIIINEIITGRGILGCVFMLTGMIISQQSRARIKSVN